MIRRYLNGETRLDELQSSIRQSITYGREPGELKHLNTGAAKKNNWFPRNGQRNGIELKQACGCWGYGLHKVIDES